MITYTNRKCKIWNKNLLYQIITAWFEKNIYYIKSWTYDLNVWFEIKIGATAFGWVYMAPIILMRGYSTERYLLGQMFHNSQMLPVKKKTWEELFSVVMNSVNDICEKRVQNEVLTLTISH